MYLFEEGKSEMILEYLECQAWARSGKEGMLAFGARVSVENSKMGTTDASKFLGSFLMLEALVL